MLECAHTQQKIFDNGFGQFTNGQYRGALFDSQQSISLFPFCPGWWFTFSYWVRQWHIPDPLLFCPVRSNIHAHPSFECGSAGEICSSLSMKLALCSSSSQLVSAWNAFKFTPRNGVSSNLLSIPCARNIQWDKNWLGWIWHTFFCLVDCTKDEYTDELVQQPVSCKTDIMGR